MRRKYLGSEKVFHDQKSFGKADLTYWSRNYVAAYVICGTYFCDLTIMTLKFSIVSILNYI